MGNFGGDKVTMIKFHGVLDFFECLPKVLEDIPDFLEDFFIHMVLLKQQTEYMQHTQQMYRRVSY